MFGAEAITSYKKKNFVCQGGNDSTISVVYLWSFLVENLEILSCTFESISKHWDLYLIPVYFLEIKKMRAGGLGGEKQTNKQKKRKDRKKG